MRGIIAVTPSHRPPRFSASAFRSSAAKVTRRRTIGRAVAAAAVIAWNGWRLLLPGGERIDGPLPPDRELVEQIRAVAGTISGVDGVEKCFVRKMGYQFFVDMHLEVDPQMTVEHSHRIGHEVKNKVRAEIPSVRDVLIHIEPLKRETKPAP